MSDSASAARYARALLDVAVREADPEAVGRDLEAFAALVGAHADLARVLGNPVVPAPRKVALVDVLTSRAALSDPVKKLVALLAQHDRLALLPLVNESYRTRLLEHLNVVRAEVTTAVPLDAEKRVAIERGLRELTGREVVMSAAVDPGILGGVVTRIGSTVYDGSLRRQLERMRERLAGGTRETA